MQAIYLLALLMVDHCNPRLLTIHRFADILGKVGMLKRYKVPPKKNKTTHMDLPSLAEFAHEYFTIVPGL